MHDGWNVLIFCKIYSTCNICWSQRMIIAVVLFYSPKCLTVLLSYVKTTIIKEGWQDYENCLAYMITKTQNNNHVFDCEIGRKFYL